MSIPYYLKGKKMSNTSRRNFLQNSLKASAAASLALNGFPHIIPSSVFGQNAPSEHINIGCQGPQRWPYVTQTNLKIRVIL